MQQPTPTTWPERPLEPAELAVLRALDHIHTAGESAERWPQLATIAHVARLTYASTVGAVRALAYHYAYVTPRAAGGSWQDGVSITTTGEAALSAHAAAAAAAGMPLAAFCEPS